MATTFGPYSPTRQAGDLCFTSGHVGVDPTTKTAPLTIAEQTRQTLENLQITLEGVGLSIDDVIKTTVYVTNMADFSVVNEVYVSYFAEPRPTRTTVGVKELPHVGGDNPILIEIEAIAMRRK